MDQILYINLKRIIGIFILTGILQSCGGKTAEHEPLEEGERRISAAFPKQQLYAQSWSFAGTFKPAREANLGASLPGRVEKIFFQEGDFVREGTLIAQLSAEPAIMAGTEYEALQTDYQRVKRLLDRGSITQQEFDHVEARYKASKARYNLMKKNTQVHAPFSGYIMEILVQEGETFMFQPGLKLGVSHSPGIVRLMQTQNLILEFAFPENLYAFIQEGKKAEIQVEAIPGENFTGTLKRIKPMVSIQNRNITAQVEVPNPQNKILVGMYAQVHIKSEEKEYWFVPRHAVHEHSSGHFVWWIDEESLLRKKNVNNLFLHQGNIAVEGLSATDKIVWAGADEEKEGEKVAYKMRK